MKKFMMMACCCMILTGGLPGIAAAEDTYLSLTVGGFLPNEKGDSNNNNLGGMRDFDTGYDLGLAVGFRPAPYAAIEVGSGFYTANRNTSTPTVSEKLNFYGVPVTATAKGILTSGKFDIFAGGGFGYYFTLFDRDKSTVGRESVHGNALGYHLTGGFDYRINEHYSFGTEIRWFSTKPSIKFTDTSEVKWDAGGTLLNLGMKYNF